MSWNNNNTTPSFGTGTGSAASGFGSAGRGIGFGSVATSGFGSAGKGTGFGSAGSAPGFGSAGRGTGFGSAGRGTGFGSAGSAPGFGSAGRGAGFGSAGSAPGFGSAGSAPGFGSAGRGTGFGSAGRGTGFGSAGRGAGFGSAGSAPGFGSAGSAPGFGSAGRGTGFGSAGRGSNNSGFGSNTAGRGSNNSGFGSDTAGRGSNNSGFGSNTAGRGSNNSGFGSNSAGRGSNKSGFGSNTAGRGSNNSGFGSNSAGRGSNNSGFGSNSAGRGSNNSGFGSNSAGRGSNNSGFGSNTTGFGSTSASFGTASKPNGSGWKKSNTTEQHQFGTDLRKSKNKVSTTAKQQGFGFGKFASTRSPSDASSFGSVSQKPGKPAGFGFGRSNTKTSFGSDSEQPKTTKSFGFGSTTAAPSDKSYAGFAKAANFGFVTSSPSHSQAGYESQRSNGDDSVGRKASSHKTMAFGNKAKSDKDSRKPSRISKGGLSMSRKFSRPEIGSSMSQGFGLRSNSLQDSGGGFDVNGHDDGVTQISPRSTKASVPGQHSTRTKRGGMSKRIPTPGAGSGSSLFLRVPQQHINSEDVLKGYFEQFGVVESLVCKTHKGIAFMEMRDPQAAAQVVATKYHKIQGETVTVLWDKGSGSTEPQTRVFQQERGDSPSKLIKAESPSQGTGEAAAPLSSSLASRLGRKPSVGDANRIGATSGTLGATSFNVNKPLRAKDEPSPLTKRESSPMNKPLIKRESNASQLAISNEERIARKQKMLKQQIAQREALLHAAAAARKQQAKATTSSASKGFTIGACMRMCPVEETEKRERENGIHLLEKVHPELPENGTKLEDLTIKSLTRSSAGLVLNVPELVRPDQVLEQTLMYLWDRILDIDRNGPDPRFRDSHLYTTGDGETPSAPFILSFVNDRTRSIRKDYSLQGYLEPHGPLSLTCIRVFEQCARLHILADAMLCECSKQEGHDETLNRQEGNNCLKALNEMYDQARVRIRDAGDFSLFSKNEPELRAYYILLQMNSRDRAATSNYIMNLQATAPDLMETVPVRRAIAILDAFRSNNYVAFFEIVRHPSTPFLVACLMHGAFVSLWENTFMVLNKTMRKYSAEKLLKRCAFNDMEHLDSFAKYVGVPLSTSSNGQVVVCFGESRKDESPASSFARCVSTVVQQKLMRPDGSMELRKTMVCDPDPVSQKLEFEQVETSFKKRKKWLDAQRQGSVVPRLERERLVPGGRLKPLIPAKPISTVKPPTQSNPVRVPTPDEVALVPKVVQSTSTQQQADERHTVAAQKKLLERERTKQVSGLFKRMSNIKLRDAFTILNKHMRDSRAKEIETRRKEELRTKQLQHAHEVARKQALAKQLEEEKRQQEEATRKAAMEEQMKLKQELERQRLRELKIKEEKLQAARIAREEEMKRKQREIEQKRLEAARAEAERKRAVLKLRFWQWRNVVSIIVAHRQRIASFRKALVAELPDGALQASGQQNQSQQVSEFTLNVETFANSNVALQRGVSVPSTTSDVNDTTITKLVELVSSETGSNRWTSLEDVPNIVVNSLPGELSDARAFKLLILVDSQSTSLVHEWLDAKFSGVGRMAEECGEHAGERVLCNYWKSCESKTNSSTSLLGVCIVRLDFAKCRNPEEQLMMHVRSCSAIHIVSPLQENSSAATTMINLVQNACERELSFMPPTLLLTYPGCVEPDADLPATFVSWPLNLSNDEETTSYSTLQFLQPLQIQNTLKWICEKPRTTSSLWKAAHACLDRPRVADFLRTGTEQSSSISSNSMLLLELLPETLPAWQHELLLRICREVPFTMASGDSPSSSAILSRVLFQAYVAAHKQQRGDCANLGVEHCAKFLETLQSTANHSSGDASVALKRAFLRHLEDLVLVELLRSCLGSAVRPLLIAQSLNSDRLVEAMRWSASNSSIPPEVYKLPLSDWVWETQVAPADWPSSLQQPRPDLTIVDCINLVDEAVAGWLEHANGALLNAAREIETGSPISNQLYPPRELCGDIEGLIHMSIPQNGWNSLAYRALVASLLEGFLCTPPPPLNSSIDSIWLAVERQVVDFARANVLVGADFDEKSSLVENLDRLGAEDCAFGVTAGWGESTPVEFQNGHCQFADDSLLQFHVVDLVGTCRTMVERSSELDVHPDRGVAMVTSLVWLWQQVVHGTLRERSRGWFRYMQHQSRTNCADPTSVARMLSWYDRSGEFTLVLSRDHASSFGSSCQQRPGSVVIAQVDEWISHHERLAKEKASTALSCAVVSASSTPTSTSLKRRGTPTVLAGISETGSKIMRMEQAEENRFTKQLEHWSGRSGVDSQSRPSYSEITSDDSVVASSSKRTRFDEVDQLLMSSRQGVVSSYRSIASKFCESFERAANEAASFEDLLKMSTL